MAKFNVKVTRVDEYEIEVNWTEEEIQEFSKNFFEAETQEEIAKTLAMHWMRNEDKYFIDGFGYIKELDINDKVKGVPYTKKDGSFGYPLPDELYTIGISIKPISQDMDYETEVSVIADKIKDPLDLSDEEEDDNREPWEFD